MVILAGAKVSALFIRAVLGAVPVVPHRGETHVLQVTVLRPFLKLDLSRWCGDDFQRYQSDYCIEAMVALRHSPGLILYLRLSFGQRLSSGNLPSRRHAHGALPS